MYYNSIHSIVGRIYYTMQSLLRIALSNKGGILMQLESKFRGLPLLELCPHIHPTLGDTITLKNGKKNRLS